MPLIKKCAVCEKEFRTKPFFVKNGGGKYCSKECQYSGLKTGNTRPCHVCGKETYKKITQLSRSKSQKFFCGKSCQTKWRNEQFVGEKHANWRNGKYVYRSVLTRAGIKKICSLCKSEDTRILAVHHIDKNHNNNEVSNLVWLCHNCHFLVHHYEEERINFMETLV